MKAIRVHQYGGPEVMRLEEMPVPEPGAGEVLVRVRAAGVNPVDVYRRSGGSGYNPPLPFTPGTDAAGVVEAAGEKAWAAAGTKVYASGALTGTYAEMALCKASDVHPLPEGLTYSQGAAVGIPYGTAYRALFQRARVSAGEVLLVHGASGGVGTAALQLAQAAGLRVSGTAGTERGILLAQEQGAERVFNHRSDGYEKGIMDWTGGRGVDVILEMLANVNLDRDLALLAPRGRVVVIGSRGAVSIDPRQAMALDSSILGVSLRNAAAQEETAIHAALAAGFRNGTLKPVIGREMPLSQASQAHQAVMEPGAYGKIVLLP
ncbi:MAG: NADPH:quinone reductase [Elusimicrobia bacterium]|nr:NADPH:quinone reductase [Elusimicrobiota bacterium]